MTHISQSESEGNLLYVRLVSRIPPGKPEEWASSLKPLSLSTFKVFLRRDYSLTLTPTSWAAGASHNSVPTEMMSFKSCDLSSPVELQPRYLSPAHALCAYIHSYSHSKLTPLLIFHQDMVRFGFFFLVILHDKGHADILVCLLSFTTTPSSSFYRAEVIFFHRQIHPLLGSYLCRGSTGVFWEHNAI